MISYNKFFSIYLFWGFVLMNHEFLAKIKQKIPFNLLWTHINWEIIYVTVHRRNLLLLSLTILQCFMWWKFQRMKNCKVVYHQMKSVEWWSILKLYVSLVFVMFYEQEYPYLFIVALIRIPPCIIHGTELLVVAENNKKSSRLGKSRLLLVFYNANTKDDCYKWSPIYLKIQLLSVCQYGVGIGLSMCRGFISENKKVWWLTL